MKQIEVAENFSVEEASECREKIYKLINEGEKNFKFDFSKCTFIDSTGLGVLVGIYKKCAEVGGDVTLYSIKNSKVKEIFKLTRLDKVFEIYN